MGSVWGHLDIPIQRIWMEVMFSACSDNVSLDNDVSIGQSPKQIELRAVNPLLEMSGCTAFTR